MKEYVRKIIKDGKESWKNLTADPYEDNLEIKEKIYYYSGFGWVKVDGIFIAVNGYKEIRTKQMPQEFRWLNMSNVIPIYYGKNGNEGYIKLGWEFDSGEYINNKRLINDEHEQIKDNKGEYMLEFPRVQWKEHYYHAPSYYGSSLTLPRWKSSHYWTKELKYIDYRED